MSITLDAAALHHAVTTAALFASADKVLPVFTGVHVVKTGDVVVFEATDRFVVGRVTLSAEGPDADFMIPGDLLKGFLAAAKLWRGLVTVEPSSVAAGGLVASQNGDAVIWSGQSAHEQDREFPKLQSIFETHASTNEGDRVPVSVIGADKLAKLGKIKRRPGEGGSRPTPPPLQFDNGATEKPIRVRSGDWLDVLIMPMKPGSANVH